MSWKKQKIQMPTTMAGILGLSPTEKIGGLEISPQSVIIFAIAMIVIVKLLTHLFS